MDKQFIDFEKVIQDEFNKGNVCYLQLDGLAVTPFSKFVLQPIDGILYDLNRLEEVIGTYINEQKWVNDFALTKLLRYYYEENEKLKKQINELTIKTDDTLTIEKIRKYQLPERAFKPDYNDTAIEFTLPNGIKVVGYTQLNNSNVSTNSLEGLDGWIYITMESELVKLISQTYEEVIEDIANRNPDFKREDY